MPTSRRQQVFPEVTPYYHCISRCVRRAWLCGDDPVTGYNFDHRKQWIEDRLLFLSQVFAIDLAAYAVMSNHYHVVLHLDPARCSKWKAHEVIERWGRLCRLPDAARAFLLGETLSQTDYAALQEKLVTWQNRLSDLSWFMRFVNEPLARMANQEDGCTGRFWEGRFKCQALLDERALLTCMAYVDLNPVRAGIAKRPEDSPHTSIRRRIVDDQASLQPFADTADPVPHLPPLPVAQNAYFQLVDWSGRVLVAGKRGSIPKKEPSILQRLGGRDNWIAQIAKQQHKRPFVGSIARLREVCAAVGRAWIWGSGQTARCSKA